MTFLHKKAAAGKTGSCFCGSVSGRTRLQMRYSSRQGSHSFRLINDFKLIKRNVNDPAFRCRYIAKLDTRRFILQFLCIWTDFGFGNKDMIVVFVGDAGNRVMTAAASCPGFTD